MVEGEVLSGQSGSLVGGGGRTEAKRVVVGE